LETQGSLFEGTKSLKMVLPCLVQTGNNDNVIKEYIAYKLFEIISPYHFKTKLLDVSFEEEHGKKIKNHLIKGFLIEDDEAVAERFGGNVYKNTSHPLNHKPIESVRNTIFQYLIGNTDFSQAYLHNVKIIFADDGLIPLPYDFDMSGLVNTSYAVVSVIQGEQLDMTSVTQRKYRGFVRDVKVFNLVRQEILDKKIEILAMLDTYKSQFENPKEFSGAKEYVLSFFTILEDKTKFKKEIIDQARIK
ncbi:MAG: hypothetical protein WBM83_09720, partial [Flavobacteriaceae bacterium]